MKKRKFKENFRIIPWRTIFLLISYFRDIIEFCIQRKVQSIAARSINVDGIKISTRILIALKRRKIQKAGNAKRRRL